MSQKTVKALGNIILITGIIFLFATCKSGVSASHPDNNEAISILKEKIAQTNLEPDFFTNIQIEIIGWKKEGDDWLAYVRTTGTATRGTIILAPESFEKLVYHGSIRAGQNYSKESIVVFSVFGNKLVPRPPE